MNKLHNAIDIKIFLAFLIPFLFSSILFGFSNESAGDALPPDVSNVYHVYEYPTYSETIEIFATVTDVDGVKSVQLQFCMYPSGVCSPPMDMNNLGGDVYNITIGPIDTSTNLIDYTIWVEDNLSNFGQSEYFWFALYNYFETNATVEPTSSYTLNSVWVNGTAHYGLSNTTGLYPNWSAPAKYCDVNVSIKGTSAFWLSQTDSAGDFSIRITMPSLPSTYSINVTISNRTIFGYNETSILVEPLNILTDPALSHTVRYPMELLWVNGTAIYNNGSNTKKSNVTVTINGQEWDALTDNQGAYGIEVTAPAMSGSYDVNVTVFNESIGISNTTILSLLVTDVPVPDIAIAASDINFSKPLPLVGETLTIFIKIHNTGTAEAESFLVYTFIDAELADYQLVVSIQPSGTIQLNFSQLYIPGIHTVQVFTDYTNVISEASENNNNASTQFFVDWDNDGDGIGDTIDDDDDNDEYPDDQDDFPFDPSEWLDTDSDGVGNNEDTDDDNDGYLDWNDRFHLDANEWEDTDNDGLGDNADDDDDGDGVLDTQDAFPRNHKEWNDNDGDGLADLLDWDDDNDGMPDYWERDYNLYPENPDDAFLDHDGDGLKNIEEYRERTNPKDKDSDDDGVWDSEDFAPLDESVISSSQLRVERFVLIELIAVIISVFLLLFLLTKKG